MNITAIILAAGASTRMGKSKQLLPVNGQPLLIHTVQTARQADVKNVVVVLGANHEEHEASLKGLAVDIVINPNWQRGMGSSLKAATNHVLAEHPAVDAVVMLVCDQPGITPAHLNTLIRQHKKSLSPVVASYYADTAGVPALFHKSTFQELLNLDDRQGAQKIIRQQANLSVVNFPAGAIDLDTPEDYEHFIKTKKPSAG